MRTFDTEAIIKVFVALQPANVKARKDYEAAWRANVSKLAVLSW